MSVQTSKKITYKLYGSSAILIEWEAKIALEINKEIVSFKNKILEDKGEEIEDVIIGYHSILLKFKEELKSFLNEKELLQEIYKNSKVLKISNNYLWEIPVCYDIEFGVDLIEMSKKLNLTTDEIIQKHSESVYTVYFIGFLPGFLYLGGLDELLHTPRKVTPRLKVSKGSVAIGGAQTGVYPEESAGGWNLIGNTPISFFDITKEQPCFAKSGDQIQFKPISKSIYIEMTKQVNLEPTKTMI